MKWSCIRTMRAGSPPSPLLLLQPLRVISAVLHERRGSAVPTAAEHGDLRLEQLVLVVPLVACLLALSAWPDAVSGHSFPATVQTSVVREL